MRKIIALFLTLAMVVSLAACASPAEPAAPPPAASTPAASTPAASAPAAPAEPTPVYPIDTNVTLRYWLTLQSNWLPLAANQGETEFGKEWVSRTGVNVEWIHPPQGGEQEAFTVLIASGNLPDVIEWNWVSDYPGGSTGAIQDRVILDLTDIIPEHSPALNQYILDNPDVARQMRNDDGRLFVYPFIRGHDMLKTTTGPVIRTDFLAQTGLALPETIQDWEELLMAFKAMGIEVPYTAQSTSAFPLDGVHRFTSAFDLRPDNNGLFIGLDGNLQYMYSHDNYREFIETMNRWHVNGLLDPEFLNTNRALMDSNMLSGRSAVAVAPGGGAVGPWIITGQAEDPNFDLVAARFPSRDRNRYTSFGGTSHDFTEASRGMAAITATSQNVEIAAKVLDYNYTEEGHILVNFGIEGVSWNWGTGAQGQPSPVYDRKTIFEDPQFSIANMMSFYSRGNMNGPFIQDVEYIIQFYDLPQQKNALVEWTKQIDPASTLLPAVSLTPEESATVQRIV
ncbi:MAG: extracellular solute-binding protein, partial [Oscillospiraceae bacterium]|nr:extracellular solute-binding protein [Oscillospiraceae bacterium]